MAIWIAAFFSPKAKQWMTGRRHLFSHLSSAISTKQYWIWFHAASLGEFEQGRPLLELMRERHPGAGILLTFFSPSGYLVRKDYSGADYVTYMPLDTASNAKRLIEIVKPGVAVFVKYDIWYHHLTALEHAGVPTFLISAHLRKEQIYFKPAARFLGDRLRSLTHIFTQTESCALMLREQGFVNVTHAGDTRLDRVLTIAAAPKDFSWLRQCFGDGPVLVAGSTWPADEKRLFPATRTTGIGLIIAPHEIHEERLQNIERQLPGAIRLSELVKNPVAAGIVIADTMGDLAYLYTVGDVAYVGGGFGAGIHNILEPIAYGLPVIIGPRFQKFTEAEILVQEGAVRSVKNAGEIVQAIEDFTLSDNREKIRSAITGYVQSQRGATQRIYDYVKSYL